MLNPKLSAGSSRLAYSDIVGNKLVSFATDSGTTSARPVCEDCQIHAFFANASEALVQSTGQVVRQDLATGARAVVRHEPEGSAF